MKIIHTKLSVQHNQMLHHFKTIFSSLVIMIVAIIFATKGSLFFVFEHTNAASLPSGDISETQNVHQTFVYPGQTLNYSIKYANHNNFPVANGKVYVKFDPVLQFTTGTVPGILVTGNTYMFSISTMQQFSTGAISVSAQVDSTTPPGTLVKTTSLVYGDVNDTNINNNVFSSMSTVVEPQNPTNCANTLTASIVMNYSFTTVKDNIWLNSLSYSNNIFPVLIEVDEVKQLNPVPNAGELSTDRGDFANAPVPESEDPGQLEITAYMSNNNLNNLIDVEGIKTMVVDLSFEEIMYDNNISGDAMGEILIFERGKNSDMYIQAVDALGGNLLGTQAFLSRTTQLSAGFSVDTTEIGSSQQMGYRRVDLNTLGVPAIKYLRITAIPAHAGPDFKVIGLDTTKCTADSVDLGIGITSNKPIVEEGEQFMYTINYYNNGPLTDTNAKIQLTLPTKVGFINSSIPHTFLSGTTYEFYIGTLLSGQSGQFYLTGLVGSGTFSGELLPITGKIWGDHNDFITGNNIATYANMVKKLSTPPTLLTLTALCSDNPAVVRTRRVKNENSFPITYTRTLLPAGITGSSIISGNTDFTFNTQTHASGNTLSISVGSSLHDTKTSNSSACPGLSVDLGILASVTPYIVYPNTIITYTVPYYNSGPNNASGVFVQATLHPNVQYLSSSLTSVVLTGGVRQFWVGFLPVGGTGHITITGKILPGVYSGQYLTGTFFINGAVIDINMSNNTAYATVRVAGTGTTGGGGGGAGGGGGGGGGGTGLTGSTPPSECIGGTCVINIETTKIFEQPENLVGLGCYYSDEPYQTVINDYPDLNIHWSKNFGAYMTLNCIMKGRGWIRPGTPAPKFDPEDGIKVNEAMKVFTKIRGIGEKLTIKGEKYIYDGSLPFNDVRNNDREAVYADPAYKIGIMEGLYTEINGKKILDGYRYITRKDAIKMLIKTYELIHGTQHYGDLESFDTAFIDNIDGTTYYSYILKAEKLGLIQGIMQDGQRYILPDAIIKRGEFAKIVSLAFQDMLKVFYVDELQTSDRNTFDPQTIKTTTER